VAGLEAEADAPDDPDEPGPPPALAVLGCEPDWPPAEPAGPDAEADAPDEPAEPWLPPALPEADALAAAPA
jgi:hypothetical protein